MISKARLFSRGLLLLLAAGFAGCGGADDDAIPTAAVEGSVTLDGTPLKAGIVRFVPIEDTPGGKVSVNVVDGQFALEEHLGPAVGKHRIEIESTDDGGYAMDDEDAIERLRESGVKRIDAVTIPPIYNSRSTLAAEVAADQTNTYTFELKSSGK